MLNVNFVTNTPSNNDAITILISEQLKIDNNIRLLDQQYNGIISKTIQDKNVFAGKFGQIKLLTTTNKDGDIKYLIIVGIGNEKELTSSSIEELGGKILSSAKTCGANTISIELTNEVGEFNQAKSSALLASGAILASYRFSKYMTKQKEEDKLSVKSIEILTNNVEESEKLFIEKKAVISGVFFARDCISEPPNILYPDSYAEKIIQALEPLGISVEVLGEREMRNHGMGAILGVGQGSKNESKLVIMNYTGASKDSAPIAFVGKGVTFDSGGLSLKPSANMADMKYDMAGSAAVVGTIKTLALRGAKVNAVGIIGLVENMPGGNAQRPSDVVTTMSNQTVEVLDTDAEGRLVLADVIWYAQEKFQPKCVIDLATLTGAILVALGNSYAGLFTNDDNLADKLIKAGSQVNELLWRMPLHKDFDEMLKSDIADIANLGNSRGLAGSSTAAHFIGRFIKNGTVWAHLDIAGMAWERKGSPICPKGAIGYGVKLLNQFIQDYYEGQ